MPAGTGTLIAYLGLGSNVGDRLANLRTAVDLLDSNDGISVMARSSVYETEPVGGVREQRDFYNAVVKVETDLEPHELLDLCKRVESELGRDPGGERHGPRPIDVDLLLMGDLVVGDDRLRLPHPQIRHRRFVLDPLLELDETLSLPDGAPLDEALAALAPSQRAERVAGI